jgi:spore coat protein H
MAFRGDIVAEGDDRNGTTGGKVVLFLDPESLMGDPLLDMSRLILLLVVGLLAWEPANAAQPSTDEAGRFFDFTNLWTIHLTLSRANWSAMEPAGPNGPGMFKRDYPWSSCTFDCAGQTLTNLAVRFKGNSSFNSTRGGFKRPFKLDFNRGQKGRTFLGLKKLSLNNNFNDATQFREALAYEAYRRADVPAPRTAFARVYLTLTGERTNEFLGLYTLVEAVDDDFLKLHFGTKKGLLFKPDGLRSLDYLGEDWRAYTNRYVPKTEVQSADAQRFIALTKLIVEADDATFERELPARLDLNNFLRYLALTAVLANYDSFVGNGHNYYLFQSAGEGKVAFIPWDLNEAFGGHPMAGSRQVQAEFSVLRPQGGSNRLIERVLANPNWAAAYWREMAAALTNACAPSRLTANVEQLARITQETVFAESALAKTAFQRIALGQTNVALPERQPNGWPPGRGFAPNPGFGPFPGIGRDEMPLADWITLRAQNVADELAGKRSGRIPRMQNAPFGPGGRGGPPRDRPGDPIGEELFPPELVLPQQLAIGLSAEQRSSIEAALQQAQPRLQETERRLREETERLASMVKEDRVDEPRVLAQSDKILDLEKEIRRTHLRLLIAIKNQLSPEQQMKLKGLKTQLGAVQGKAARVQASLQGWQERGRDPAVVVQWMQEFETLLREGNLKEAEAVLDRALKSLESPNQARPGL